MGRRVVRFSARIAVSLLFAATLAGFSGSTRAEQCTLKLMATLPMTDVPGAFTVPVSVNGEAHQFLLDTAGVYTSLAERIVQRQQLREVSISGTDIYNSEGQRLGKGVLVDSLKLGNNEAKHVHMFVHDGLGQDVDGTLAPNILQLFDVDLDFAGHKVNLF